MRRSPRHSYQVCMRTLVVQWRQSCQNVCCTVFVCFFKLVLSWFACFPRRRSCAELVRSIRTQNNSCTDMRRMCLKNRRFDGIDVRRRHTEAHWMMQSCYLVPRPFMFKLTLERDLSKNPDFCVQSKFTNLITNSFFFNAFVCSSFSWSPLSSPNFTAIFTVLLICLSSSPWPSSDSSFWSCFTFSFFSPWIECTTRTTGIFWWVRLCL